MPSDLPDHKAMFVRFLLDSGDEAAARTRFQRLITDLVMVRLPAASEVTYPGGGDWGIDTYVGSLDDEIIVWQSKFFTVWGRTQQNEIRRSFKQVINKATQQKFKVTAWTLCVPSVLPPDQQKWFDGWSGRQERETGVRINLWNGSQIRSALQQADASHVRSHYFPDQLSIERDLPVAALANPTALSDTLFVLQLESAGYTETDAAKGFFFAAEAMARDVAGRGIPAEICALTEAELEAHGVWEQTYNAKSAVASDDGRMEGLISEVSKGVAQLANTQDLRLRPAHRRGLVHRLVEGARAGWVTHWRDIAAGYKGTPAGMALEQSGELSSPGGLEDGTGEEAEGV
ncbi:hypothetical protein [Brevibacterium sp. Marseille-P9724]|uniref:hypothetical protein n=1 Tax=Brevibacterium sp. Marseille-P9724 TaxID=2614125 RepID=UPI00125ED467|nr:hypothetical protein [Brevibacterium sp. Marseille-P9724]